MPGHGRPVGRLTLAFGIAAATTTFSAVYAALLRPLPFADRPIGCSSCTRPGRRRATALVLTAMVSGKGRRGRAAPRSRSRRCAIYTSRRNVGDQRQRRRRAGGRRKSCRRATSRRCAWRRRSGARSRRQRRRRDTRWRCSAIGCGGSATTPIRPCVGRTVARQRRAADDRRRDAGGVRRRQRAGRAVVPDRDGAAAHLPRLPHDAAALHERDRAPAPGVTLAQAKAELAVLGPQLPHASSRPTRRRASGARRRCRSATRGSTRAQRRSLTAAARRRRLRAARHLRQRRDAAARTRARSRRGEMAIRLALGASRRRLVAPAAVGERGARGGRRARSACVFAAWGVAWLRAGRARGPAVAAEQLRADRRLRHAGRGRHHPRCSCSRSRARDDDAVRRGAGDGRVADPIRRRRWPDRRARSPGAGAAGALSRAGRRRRSPSRCCVSCGALLLVRTRRRTCRRRDPGSTTQRA